MNALPAPLEEARRLSYLHPTQAQAIASTALAQASPQASPVRAWAQALLAMLEVRIGDAALAGTFNDAARETFAALSDHRGLWMCDEVHAVALRREGQLLRSHQLQRQLDAKTEQQDEQDAFERFFAANSRAITAKLMNDSDGALAQFYRALEAANRCAWEGPLITALANLGGYHQDLYNLDDALSLSQQAFDAARAAGALHQVTAAGTNLIVIHHTMGRTDAASAMADLLLAHPEEGAPDALDRSPMPMALARLGAGRIDEALAWLAKGSNKSVADGDGRAMWGWIMARCRIAQGDAAAARQVCEPLLKALESKTLAATNADVMELARAASAACEADGDAVAALAHLKHAHAVYEALVGRSSRARYRALQAMAEFSQAQRERDAEQAQRRAVESDRERLAALNQSLQTKIQEVEGLHTQMREQALHDTLTGLHNRRYLFEVVPGLIELARRQNGPLCVALLDLDHFKSLNDTRGHAAGDEVLKRFASLLKEGLRRSDVLCRYGGEEFVVVMPGVDMLDAEDTLTRLLGEFRALEINVRGKLLPPCTFSAGVAEFPRFGDQLEALLLFADRALYAAKRSGRAKVTHAATEFGTFT